MWVLVTNKKHSNFWEIKNNRHDFRTQKNNKSTNRQSAVCFIQQTWHWLISLKWLILISEQLAIQKRFKGSFNILPFSYANSPLNGNDNYLRLDNE